MSTARYLIGDVFDRLAEIPDGSVDLVVTSPPFLALRSYLPADHPDKALEIGSEATPAEFISTLLRLTAEWRRVLAPHGSIAVELGDTYSGSGGAGGDYADGGMRDGQQKFRQQRPNTAHRTHPDGSIKTSAEHRRTEAKNRPEVGLAMNGGHGWPLAKSMVGIPHLYHLSLAYGRNLLTGECSPAGQWRVRNVVAWCRPNPPVGAVGDKFRPATSYITVATLSSKRYFDGDAVRVPASEGTHARTANGVERRKNTTPKADAGGNNNRDTLAIEHRHATRPLYDWWELPTAPYPGSHYATYPEALVVPLIESMCPRRVCRKCGEPSRRIVETNYEDDPRGGTSNRREADGSRRESGTGMYGKTVQARVDTTVGWTDCGHDNHRPGMVLDPFAGSGTTLAVAAARARDAIGIDLDERNLDLARERIGMWLEES